MIRSAFRLTSITGGLICQIVPVQVSWGLWCTSLSLWKDVSAISALDLGVRVSGQALMGYDPFPEDQHTLETNAFLRGEHRWACWLGLHWREVTWEAGTGRPGSLSQQRRLPRCWDNFPTANEGATPSVCLDYWLFQVAKIPSGRV